MKKSVIGGLVLILVLVFTLPVAAEFYRYKDNHGNTIYTDDYTKVPPDQREAAEAYEEAVSKPESDTTEAPKEEVVAEPTTDDENEKTRQRLEIQGKALTQEYDALAAVRDSLKKDKEAAVSNSQIKSYNKRTVEFNARIKAYEEKRDAHTIEVEKFNARMANQESEPQSR